MKRQRKKYFNTYQAYRGKSRWKKILLWGLAVLAALALLLGAWLLLNQAEPGVAGFFKGGFSSNVTLPIALMR